MDLYVFSSNNLTNIWAGIGARRWGVSLNQAKMPGAATKAAAMPVGASGILYCVETQCFTTPFLVRSPPEAGKTELDVWPEEWALPFGIVPLGSPRLSEHKDKLQSLLPSLNDGSIPWHHFLHVQGSTVFVPSAITANDWAAFIARLAMT
jgi:hypothetical protein